MSLLPPLELRPEPGPARDWVRAELAKKEYQPNLVERILTWIGDRIDDIFRSAQGVGGLSPAVALVALLVVLGVLVLVLGRLRREPPGRAPDRALHEDTRTTAAEHRAVAERALAEERWDDAVVNGLRALALGLVERALIDDLPGATAREVAAAAARVFAGERARLEVAATLFDDVRYGDRPATRAGATDLLDLEEALRNGRPGGDARTGPVLAVPR